ncbi:uncharacterized protein LOC110103627 [Dendrobium catenatum]|uniref:uncharacterized protein LOC110103627 n=1 Tax=Dendrobium catenatum TaxID=906689 RepID=UPI0009F4004F|nr:uncharacterized protein LOC110103627 [Dendrobium catenatum]
MDIPKDELELLRSFSGRTISAMAKYNNVKWEEDEYAVIQDWKCIKNLKLNPRVSYFWWKLMKNVIPTMDFLMHRRLLDNNLCPRGCDMKEDVEHVAVKCSKLIQVIQMANRLGFSLPVFNSLEECLKFLRKQGKVDPFSTKTYCALVYHSWKSRNNLVHEGQELGAGGNLYSDHWGANPHYMLTSTSWHPPPPGWIKVNIDASLLSSNEVGIGGIFRDHKGRMLLSFGFSVVNWDIGFLELLAFRSLARVIKDWMLDAKGLIMKETI